MRNCLSSLAGFIVYLFLGSSAFSPVVEYTYAISLAPSYNDLSTFAEVVRNKGKLVRVTPISRKEFVAQAAGFKPSKHNPAGINLFAQHGITRCEWEYNKSDNTSKPMCPVTLEVWKLRFKNKPGSQNNTANMSGSTSGWAAKELAPDDRQKGLLRQYGIVFLNDFAVGDKAFLLLRNIQDPGWVSGYR